MPRDDGHACVTSQAAALQLEGAQPASIAECSEGSIGSANDQDAPAHADEAAALERQADEATADGESGERLFALLVELSPDNDIKRNDYYDDESGWDMQGLRSDLQLCKPGALAAE